MCVVFWVHRKIDMLHSTSHFICIILSDDDDDDDGIDCSAYTIIFGRVIWRE